MNKKKAIALRCLCAALCAMLVFTGCSSKTEEESSESVSTSESSAAEESKDLEVPDFSELIAEKVEENEDTIGWVNVPNTKIDDVVVCRADPDDMNDFYYRRDFNKNKAIGGVLYADSRSVFGDYTKENLPINTCIYGHSLDTNPDGTMFAPMINFNDGDFAKETPYFFFATDKGTFVCEIFSVSYVHWDIAYNRPDLTEEEFTEMLEQVRARSLFDYDVEVTADDKIVTLSTCTYSLPDRGEISYPSEYRFAVMGKVIDVADATKTEAAMTVREKFTGPETDASEIEVTHKVDLDAVEEEETTELDPKPGDDASSSTAASGSSSDSSSSAASGSSSAAESGSSSAVSSESSAAA